MNFRQLLSNRKPLSDTIRDIKTFRSKELVKLIKNNPKRKQEGLDISDF